MQLTKSMVHDGLSYVSNPQFLSPDPGTCLYIIFTEIMSPHVGSCLSIAIRTVCTQSELRKFGKFNLCAESVEDFLHTGGYIYIGKCKRALAALLLDP